MSSWCEFVFGCNVVDKMAPWALHVHSSAEGRQRSKSQHCVPEIIFSTIHDTRSVACCRPGNRLSDGSRKHHQSGLGLEYQCNMIARTIGQLLFAICFCCEIMGLEGNPNDHNTGLGSLGWPRTPQSTGLLSQMQCIIGRTNSSTGLQ